jgi:hypothetical protein
METQITAGEIRLLSALVHCRIPAGTVDRRFVDVMAETAKDNPSVQLTAGQHGYIRRLAFRYRQQLPADVLESVINPGEEAGKPTPPAEPAPAESVVAGPIAEPDEPTLLEEVAPS